ncbi:hypothetical protein, partial [Bradyrhizobium sp.]|uniref:hypothetical protein n=1 Tax=Bradyrhizobium sp. TaxID=376 RepID=UPI002B8CA329
MIEKVRSVAMSFGPQINGEFRVAALISAAHAPGKRPYRGLNVRNYSNFTMMKVVCSTHTGAVQERSHRLQIDRKPASLRSTGQRLPDGAPLVRQM